MKTIENRNSIPVIGKFTNGKAFQSVVAKLLAGQRNTKSTFCKCLQCATNGTKTAISVGKGIPVFIDNGSAYIHEEHRPRMLGYHVGTDSATIGKVTADGHTVGLEIEVDYTTKTTPDVIASIATYMQYRGFNMERDGSVDAEFTGRTDNDMTGICQVVATLKGFARYGLIAFTDRTGTHFNVSTARSRAYFPNYSHRKMDAIVEECYRYMREHREDIEPVFGRVPTDYCNLRGCLGHYCGINVAHLFRDNGETNETNRFEIRLAKLNIAADDTNRYFEMAKRCIEWVEDIMTIIENNKSASVAYDATAKLMRVVEV